ncbi:10746_t:CDS:1, partial [Cetraspora pellucida]
MKDKPKRTHATIACINCRNKRIRCSYVANACKNCAKQNLQCTFIKSSRKRGPKGVDNKNVINQDDKYRAVNNIHDGVLFNNSELFNSSLYHNVQDINHFVNSCGSHYPSEFQMNIVSQGPTHYYPMELSWYFMIVN